MQLHNFWIESLGYTLWVLGEYAHGLFRQGRLPGFSSGDTNRPEWRDLRLQRWRRKKAYGHSQLLGCFRHVGCRLPTHPTFAVKATRARPLRHCLFVYLYVMNLLFSFKKIMFTVFIWCVCMCVHVHACMCHTHVGTYGSQRECHIPLS